MSQQAEHDSDEHGEWIETDEQIIEEDREILDCLA